MLTSRVRSTSPPQRLALLVTAAVCLCTAMPLRSAHASGLLIADGGNGGLLQIKEHSVHVTINNGVAVTHVTQIFQNTENRQVEALYTFPVPRGASVANFSMWINGKEMVGEVVEKERARQIYDSYKQRRRDPGLLEQTDFRTFEMRIFPIAPLAEQKVEITYYQELECDHDWATYVYPLATATRTDIRDHTAGKFEFTLDAKSQVPIVAIESPSNPNDFAIAKHTDRYWQASLEHKSGDLSRDVVLAYHLSRPKTGVDLITSRQDGSDDGFFSLTLTAGQELAARETGMDYVFVLDISGSMNDDGKLNVSRNSLGAFINALGAGDKFEVMTFNVEPHALFNHLSDAGPEAKQKAVAFLNSQEARGGTVLHPALTRAYKYSENSRPFNVVIVSDGLTEPDERSQLIDLIRHRPNGSRVFCIGVGNDVDRTLLNNLADTSGGLAAYISAQDTFDRQAAAFRRKLMHPVASDIKLTFAGGGIYDIEPIQVPNLYFGTPVRVYGRYSKPGPAKLTMSATIEGHPLQRTIDIDLPAKDQANPEIERMWAMRRVDRLLESADASSSPDSAAPEIIRLGECFSIATRYTSFIVLENDQEYRRWQIDRRNLDRIGRDRSAQEAVANELAKLREKAAADLGPAPLDKANAAPVPTPSDATPAADPTPTPNPSPTPNRTRPTPSSPPASRHNSFDFPSGGGAIDGQLGMIVVALIGLVTIAYWQPRKTQAADPSQID